MMPVTQMPTFGNSQPFSVYFGSNEGIPEGGSAGGGKRPDKSGKTPPKKGAAKGSKKTGAKTK